MKRQWIALVLCITCGLSGCASAEKITVEDAESTTQTEVSVHMFDKGMKSRLESAAYPYLKQNPQIKLTVTASENEDDNLADLKAMQRESTAPTLFCIRGQADASELNLPLADLSSHRLAEAALPGLLDEVTIGNAVCGLPVCIEAYGILANRRILNAVGLYPKEITDLKALEAAAKTLNTAIRNKSLQDRFPHLSAVFAPPEADAGIQMRTLLHTKDGGGLQAEAFSNIKATLSLERTYGTQAVGTPITPTAQMLADGQIAMAVSGNRIINAVKELSAEAAESLVFLPIFSGRINTAVPAYWAVNKDADTKQKEEALKFLTWLYQSEQGKHQSISTLFFIPAYDGFDDFPSTEALNRNAQEYIGSGMTYPLVTASLPAEMDLAYFNKKMLAYLSGAQGWDKIVREIKSDYARLTAKG